MGKHQITVLILGSSVRSSRGAKDHPLESDAPRCWGKINCTICNYCEICAAAASVGVPHFLSCD
jgi:hypothetical protein